MLKTIKWRKWLIYPAVVVVAGLFVFLFIIHMFIKPTNNADWSLDQAVLSYAKIEGDTVTIYNIRNFRYASTTDYTPDYYDGVFDLNKIKAVYYIVEPFSGIPGSAHTFLSFEFEGDKFVAISVEIRKKKGQAYHPIKGLLNQYELMYVIADERDAIKLRTNYRKDLVYVYPARTSKEKMRELFLDMIKRANYLKDNPEFYNTLTNTCTTNIVRHINAISPGSVPIFRWQIFFPRASDKLAYDLGLLDTDLSFEKAREKFFINDRAEKYADDPAFSVRIRQ